MNSTTELYPGEGLSFITIPSANKTGPINYLDVRDGTYCEGLDSGMRAAYRLMFAREKGVLTTYSGEPDDDLDGTLRAATEFAANELTRRNGLVNDGTRGAAVGFLHAVARMLGDLALSGAWRMTMLKDVADTDNYNRTEFEGQLADNAKLVEDVTPMPNIPPSISAKGSAKARRTAIAA